MIPIPFDTTHPELYFHTVNGLFIPGTDRGDDVINTTFATTLRILLKLSYREYFPIWGTCFGMEMLLEQDGHRIWNPYPADGFHPIHFTRSAKYSRLARSFSPSFRHSLETTQSTLQNHDYGISVDDMKRHPFYRVVATSLDELGKEYVAIIESKNYPIYGVQFHPESSNEPFLDFFHSELKKNSHRCDSLPPVHMTAQKNHYVF